MAKYCGSIAGDNLIQSYLDLALNEIITKFDPITVLLFGGFATGEGTVEVKNGKVIPINDIDLYVITRKKISDSIINSVSSKISKSLNIGGKDFFEHFEDESYTTKKFFHIEIRNLTLKELSGLKPTLRTFELKNSSKIIYGDKKVLNKIFDLSANEILVAEAIRLLINKFGILLLCMDKKKLMGTFTQEEKRMIVYFCVKSFLDSCSALLIFLGHYKSSYRGRLRELKKILKKEFPELSKNFPDMVNYVEWATGFKAKPDFGNVKDPIKLWFKARNFAGAVLNEILAKELMLEKNSSWSLKMKKFYKDLPHIYFSAYTKHYLKKLHLPLFLNKYLYFSQYFMNLNYFFRLSKDKFYIKPLLNWRDAGLKIAVPLILLVFAVKNKNSFNKEITSEAYDYLKQVYPVKKKDWASLRNSALKAYRAYYLQKLI